jgi:hypothetical protein
MKSEIDKIKAVLSDLKNADIEDYVLNITKALEIAVDFIKNNMPDDNGDYYYEHQDDVGQAANDVVIQISEILEVK